MMKAQRGALMVVVVRGQSHAPDALPWGKDPVPIVQEVGWAPGSVWTGAENLEPGTLQPAASRYSDYAIPAHDANMTHMKMHGGRKHLWEWDNHQVSKRKRRDVDG